MKIALVTLVLFGIAPACTNDSAAQRTLENAGFYDIELTGYAAFACADSDGTCTGFRAKNPHGKVVTGAVGCGHACKGCTIRFD